MRLRRALWCCAPVMAASVALSTRPTILGVTGGIAMGKSTCTRHLLRLGVECHDSDAAVHVLYGPGGAAVEPIRAVFGDDALCDKGTSVERTRLMKLLLAHDDVDEAFKTLEKLVHPLVRLDRDAWLARKREEGVWLAALDVPLLFETLVEEQEVDWDHVVTVSSGEAEQRRRALKRPNMTPEKLQSILSRQLGDADRRRKSDFVVDTSFAHHSAARNQIAKIVQELWDSEARTKNNRVQPRCVTFDLDNTLWPTMPPLKKATLLTPGLLKRYLPRTAATEPDLLEVDKVREKHHLETAHLGHDISARKLCLFRFLAEQHGDPVEDADALVEAIILERTRATDEFVCETARPTFAMLRERGLLIGALTNGNAAQEHSELGDCFDFWLGAADAGAAKPSVAPFLAAASAADCRVDELVHVGDSVHDDILGALRAGARAVLLTKFADDSAGLADRLAEFDPASWRVIDSLDHLPAALDELLQE